MSFALDENNYQSRSDPQTSLKDPQLQAKVLGISDERLQKGEGSYRTSVHGTDAGLEKKGADLFFSSPLNKK